MTGLPAGLYETLITEQLDTRLRLVEPDLLRRGRLDPVDAHDALTRHIAALTRRALRAVQHSDKAAEVAQKIDLANRIAAAIAELSPDSAYDEIVTSSQELLTAITTGRNPDGSPLPPPARGDAARGQCTARQR